MRLQRRHLLSLAAASAAGHALPVAAQAAWPNRPVKIVVPTGPGSSLDLIARAMSDKLAARWGQPVVIDNKPGASGIVAFGEVRRAAPDGYTLFVADTATMVVNPLINDRLPYDPERDLVPLTLMFRATFVVAVGGDSRFRGVTALLDAARREPGRVTYASLGNGHASQVAIESLAHAAGVQLLHVPFKDAGALFTAVAAGEVDFTAFSMNTMSGLIARGRLRPLAVAARTRLKDHPDLPTLAEAGAPAVEMHPWTGLVARAGTPRPLLEMLQRDAVAAIEAPAVRSRIDPLGFELTPSTPQQFRERVEADLALYAPLVREGRVSRV